MKWLYILRHAKSSWAQPGLGDIDRTLDARGIQQLELLSQWFDEQDKIPNHVMCSPSVRTRQTLDGLIGPLKNINTEFIDTLYNGTVDHYLEAVYAQSAESLLLIGHNPTCDELARYLTMPSSPAAPKLMAHHFGTASMAVLGFNQDDWANLSEASCELVEYIRPKELEAHNQN